MMLDFDAPLLSVRRSAPGSESQSNPAPPPDPNPRRSAPPFYKSDLKSGPVRNPGAIPFLWEQSPGRPKPPPPDRILIELEPATPITEHEEGEEKEEESDALETLSRTESFFVNCSVTGISEAPERTESSGRFSTDPMVRDFMLGRFLPAAVAAVSSSPHPSARKQPVLVQARELKRVENGDQQRLRFPVSYGEGVSCDYGDGEDEEEEDCYDNGQFLSKGCGFIPRFCAKSSFCLLNPVPGMKFPRHGLPPASVRRIQNPQVKAAQHGSMEEEYSWEAVDKHKPMHGNHPLQEEDASKRTSESNHSNSNIGGISLYRNEPTISPFHEDKGFIGVSRSDIRGLKADGSDSFEKDGECRSGSTSPAVDRTLHVDTVHMKETPSSKSFSDDKGIIRSVDEYSEAGVESQRMEGLVLETCRDVLQSEDTEIVETEPAVFPEKSSCEAMDENKGFKENNRVKNDFEPKTSLLPLSLPNSPSESWLSRTLPSVSSKNPSAQSFLGIGLQQRKPAFPLSSTVSNKEVKVKPLKVQRGHTRFADMLAEPLSPQSEI